MPTKPEPWDEGDEIVFRFAFTNDADVPLDPTTVTLEVACPDGTLLTWADAELDHDGVGIFSTSYIIANGSGRYDVEARGTGALPITEKRSFQVRK